MNIAIVTGSCGLVGSAAVEMLVGKMDLIIGIDNDRRKFFFGKEASTMPVRKRLSQIKTYHHYSFDIRNEHLLDNLFYRYHKDIKLIIHTAAQPSHDWAATNVSEDFTINAVGTLNLLQKTMEYCPQAVFVFTSTNKVYGDTPNALPLVEEATRYEIYAGHKWANGIPETMSIDQSKHSLFGVSKAAADLMVQEYGNYFGLRTGTFRCGCISGANHAGSEQHGFLSYMMKCAVADKPYTIIGHKGKQVRDNIDASDLAQMFWQFYQHPVPGAVFNAGGGRKSNCSVLEAINLCEQITGKPMRTSVDHNARSGDHIWYISDTKRFENMYPEWELKMTVPDILNSIYSYLQL